MTFVIYFFGSELAFFVGVGCVLGALVMSFLRHRIWARLATLIGIFGLILIALSATPLPIWFYALAAIATVACLVAARWESKFTVRQNRVLSGVVALLWLGATVHEASYQRIPSASPAGHPRLYLFGDSVSAGIGDAATNHWPEILSRTHSVEVANFSVAGATVAVALRRAKDVTLGDGIVLLEIGGNDLLGSTTDEDFERNLDQLLARVCQSGRQVLMFELPLPPFRNEYGRIQRRLAARYDVLLIPKRVFIAVLTADGATLDSIHLSRSGHQRMAETVWCIIQSGYVPPAPNP